MSSKWLLRLGFGVAGILLVAFTVMHSPEAGWSLVPVAFVILVLLFALPGRKLGWGPRSPGVQRVVYTVVFVVGAILAMLIPEVVQGQGLSWSIVSVTAIAAAVIGAVSWFTYRSQGQESEGNGGRPR